MARRLWLIDDTPSLHVIAEATAQHIGGWEFSGWLTGSEALAALAEGAAWPDVVLMDFYIGSERGDRVTRALRRQEPATHRPVIVGYSSVRAASQVIVEAGGDVIVAKVVDDAGINPALLAYLGRWH
jgi:CheY-like chemotaxis protein